MTEIDELVRRAVDTVTLIAGKAAAFATRILLGAIVVCVGGFLLGVAVLSGSIEQVWVVLGIVFGAIADRWRVHRALAGRRRSDGTCPSSLPRCER